MAQAARDYDLLYNPRLSVPDFAQFAARWSAQSERARAMLEGSLDVPYGSSAGETMDVFPARGASKALLVFIHGGYWRSLDKRDFSFLAPSLVQAGVTLAIPNYALCPQVSVRDIVMQMVQACAWLYRNGASFGAPLHSLYLCGHSAGGHLAAMMLACLWPAYAADLPQKVVQGALSVSGLYDLRDIVRATSINCDVRLDRRSALAVSPASMAPATDAPLHVAVGEKETEGFHIQQRLIRRRWKRVVKRAITCPGAHHFSILDALAEPSGALLRAALAMMQIESPA
jgi:arylformamidase